MKEVCQQGTNSIRGKSDTVFFGLIEESNLRQFILWTLLKLRQRCLSNVRKFVEGSSRPFSLF
jgi:hypothetical protein